MSNIFNKDLSSIIKQISESESPYKAFSLWEFNRKKLENVRLLTNINGHGSYFLPEYLQKNTFEGGSKVYLQEFFRGRSLLALSNSILDRHRETEKIDIAFDHSLLLDSNYMGAIDLFFEGKPIATNYESFVASLFYIRTHQINTDGSPYLFENANDIENRWEDVRRTFSNFLRFSVAIPKVDKIRTVNDLYIPISESESLAMADKRLNGFYRDAVDSIELRVQLERKNVTNFMLLSIIHIEHIHQGSLQEKFSELLRVLDEDICRMSIREIIVAYLYFKNTNSIFILANLRRLIKDSGDPIKTISNISWDFFFFRLMETWSSDTSRGEFFIPFFVTFDKRLAGLNEIYPIRSVVYDDESKKMMSIPELDLSRIIDDKKCYAALSEMFEKHKFNIRSDSPVPNTDSLMESIKSKEADLIKFFEL